MKQTLAIVILLASFGLQACQKASVIPAVSAQDKATVSKKAPREVHLCAGKDKDGSPCKRHVKVAGDYCWMHKDQDKRGQ